MTQTVFNPVRGSSVYVPDEQLHLVPMLRNFLIPSLGNLPDTIHFTVSGLAPRTTPPSGYFSPSTHPTWPLRELVMYAIDPASVPSKEFPPDTQISALMGTIVHVLANRIFKEMGILVPPPEKTCPLCHKPRGYKPGADTCNEHVVIDEKLRRRGHIDDVVRLPELGTIPVDVKTCAHHAIKSIVNHDDRPYIKGNPGHTALKAKYYGQAQEYMAMRGEDMLMLVFIGLGFPWEMREVIIKRDQPYIDALQAKYKLAREMAARGEIPAP